MQTLEQIIEELIKQELDEFNAVGGGGVSATGGQPLGIDMGPQHKTMWSGDSPEKKRKVQETTELRGIPVPQSEQEEDHLRETIDEVIENVLDKMGLHKATSSVRRNMIGGGAVYMDRHDPNQERTKHVMGKVARNLHKVPYSHDPPRTGLGESLARLLEGKIDQAIQQHSDNPSMVAFLQELKEENVLPKFIPWLIKQSFETEVIKERTPEQAKNIAWRWLQKVNRFEKMLQLNQMPPDKKDINKFEDLEDLMQWVEVAENKHTEKFKEKQGKAESTKIYEDSEYLIIEPKSEAASCVYGKGTQWCISATQSQNYFSDYSEKGARFLFVINKKTGDKDAIAFAGDIDQIEIYDAQDNSQKSGYIENKYPKSILEILNKFLETVTHATPFSTVSLEDIKKDPKVLLDYKFFYDLIAGNPTKGLEALEALAYSPREGWTSQEQGYANARIRQGIEMISGTDLRDEYDTAKRLLKIYKSNPGQYKLTLTALEILATKVISDQEGVWFNYLIPLVFQSQNMKAILTHFLANPDEQLPQLGRVVGYIENLRSRIPDPWYVGSRRAWENINNTLSVGDPDEKRYHRRLLQNLLDIGNKYGWNFEAGALSLV